MMRLLHSVWRHSRSEEGAVAVEFALLAPLLFTLLFGIICFGYFFMVAHSVQQLAAEAARASVYGITTSERHDLAEDFVDAGSTRFAILDQSALTRTVTVDTSSAASITVDVDYDLSTSILGLANGFLGLDLSTISVSAYVAY